MAKEVWFRRSDGLELVSEDGSESHRQMVADGSFVEIEGPGGADVPADPAAAADDLSKLTVKQLYERAAMSDVPVTEKMKKAELIAAIEAKAATAE